MAVSCLDNTSSSGENPSSPLPMSVHQAHNHGDPFGVPCPSCDRFHLQNRPPCWGVDDLSSDRSGSFAQEGNAGEPLDDTHHESAEGVHFSAAGHLSGMVPCRFGTYGAFCREGDAYGLPFRQDSQCLNEKRAIKQVTEDRIPS